MERAMMKARGGVVNNLMERAMMKARGDVVDT